MRATTFVLVLGLAFPSAGARADDPPKELTFVGHLQAAATVEVRSRVAGQLTKVAVREGDAVKKGDLLAEIDSLPFRLALERAKAKFQVAEAQLQLAKVKHANTKKLFDQKVVSQNELDLQTAEAMEAEAALTVAKVEVRQAEQVLSGSRITAPIDGRVSRLQSAEGNLVADQARVLTLVATDTLSVTFNVPEGVVLKLRQDGLAEPDKLTVAIGFAIDKGFPHAAKLDVIAADVDPKTGTARFRATIPNPKGLLSPGMSARVRLTPATK